jgi:hypothetical protein
MTERITLYYDQTEGAEISVKKLRAHMIYTSYSALSMFK